MSSPDVRPPWWYQNALPVGIPLVIVAVAGGVLQIPIMLIAPIMMLCLLMVASLVWARRK